MINNYILKKVKSIFGDGTIEHIQFHNCGNKEWEYNAIMKNNNVFSLYLKTVDGGAKKVFKNDSFVKVAIEYFKNNDFDLVNDYK